MTLPSYRQLVFENEYTTTPNPGGQQEFAEDWTNFFVALEGGWYSGKSFIGGRKLVTLHEYNAFDAIGDATYVASLVVAPTYSNAMDFCVPHLQDACDEAGLKHEWRGTGYLSSGKYAAPAIIIPDFGTKEQPSVILIRSADVPRRITGFTVGAAWGDEPARWKEDRFDPMNDPFLQVTGRVRDVKARLLQIMLTYTNEGDTTKVYEEMHLGMDDRALYRAPTIENVIAKDFHDRQRKMLNKELAAQYLDGKAACLRGGKVYGSFDFNTNVDGRLVLMKGVPLQASMDFNIVPGMHIELGQHFKGADLITTVHEIHAPRLDVKHAALELVSLLEDLKWKWDAPLEIFGDATGRNEWAGTGETCYTILQQVLKEHTVPYRMRVPRANPPVVDRINASNCAMADVLGRIHYKIHPRCVKLTKDYRAMQRDKFGEIDKTDRKLSHPSDADGYRIWFIRPLRLEEDETGGRISVR